jgi:hypothetical protein
MLTAMAEVGHQPAEALMSKFSQRITPSSHPEVQGAAVHGLVPFAARKHSTDVQDVSRLVNSEPTVPQLPVQGKWITSETRWEGDRTSSMPSISSLNSWTDRHPVHYENMEHSRICTSPPTPTLEPLEACRLLSRMAKVAMKHGSIPSASTASASLPASVHNSMSVDQLLTDLISSLSTLSPGRLSSLLHALALLQHQPHRRWTGRLAAVLRTRLPWMSARELTSTLWSLARLGIRPEGRWMDWLMLECQHKLPGFGAQELGNTVWAISRCVVTVVDPVL